MNKNAPRRSSLLIMLAFVLAAFGVLLYLWTTFGGAMPLRATPYVANVRFGQGSQLASQADVRVSGVTIGKATKIERSGRTADVRMEIDARYAPLPADVRATLRTKTLLGETFVALSFGTRRGPMLPDGGRISDDHVVRTVEFDDVLGVLDRDTRRDLRTILLSSAKATRGRGVDLNAGLGELAPATAAGNALLGTLARQGDDASAGIRDLGRVLGTLGDEDGAVRGLVQDGRRVLETTARTAGPLRRTVRALPVFLREARSTSGVARAVAADATPTLRALRPVTPLLRPTLDDLNDLAPDVEGVARRLRPTLVRVPKAAGAVDRIARTAGPAVDQLGPALRDVVPIAEYLRLYRNELPVTFANVAAAGGATTTNADGKTVHYLRAYTPITSESIAGALRPYPNNRVNPYPLPGSLDRGLATGRQAAATCDAANGPAPILQTLLDVSGAPPCLVQPPLSFRGRTESVPRLQPEPRQR